MEDARAALAHWPVEAEPEPLTTGLINRTFVLRRGGDPIGVLQELNTRIFDPAVHEDIEAVTAHLEARGVRTPRLVRTREGALWHQDPEGGAWRVLTWVGTRTTERVADLREARSAGALLARFHGALADLDRTFRSVRTGVHDTPAHMARLEAAVDAHRAHRLWDRVAPLAEGILEGWRTWEGSLDQPERIIHGDPKIANVRFDGTAAVALIDLDTVQRGTLQVELGDALRSWCNTASEDATVPTLDLDVLTAALEGYASGAGDVRPQEWEAVVPGLERIALELASRFARDALEESWFGWDPRFGGRGEHNLVRAEGQAALARQVREARVEAERVVSRVR